MQKLRLDYDTGKKRKGRKIITTTEVHVVDSMDAAGAATFAAKIDAMTQGWRMGGQLIKETIKKVSSTGGTPGVTAQMGTCMRIIGQDDNGLTAEVNIPCAKESLIPAKGLVIDHTQAGVVKTLCDALIGKDKWKTASNTDVTSIVSVSITTKNRN